MAPDHGSMSEALKALCELHEIDKQVLQLRQLKEADPETLRQLQHRLHQAREAVQQTEKELQKAKGDADGRDLELKAIEAEILRLRTQLATAKNIDNKQYRTFLHEIEGKDADKQVIEDQILALWTRVDEFSAELKRRRQALAAGEAEIAGETQRINAELQEIERKLQELDGPRAEKAKTIDPELLERYERVLRRRGPTAIVEVRGQSCQGCFTKLTLQNYAQLGSGKDVTFCRSCGRILSLPDEELDHFESTASRQPASEDEGNPL